MRVVLATLCLNEMEWLPKLYQQHKDWPGMERWVFVESADETYAKVNSHIVTSGGLSTDGTTQFLQELASEDERVIHIQYGFSRHTDPAQGKCAARSRYLIASDPVEPNIIQVIDADEFYTYEAQRHVMTTVLRYPNITGFCFKHRDIWHPPIFADEPLFKYEVTGGFWSIPYCRTWRWSAGLTYEKNHNTPQTPDGELLDRHMLRCDQVPGMPEWIHMGFACQLESRLAKNRFYEERGEGKTDHRGWYVQSRAAFAHWKPGQLLPKKARVIPYDGPIPEAFQ